jgi:hypothetical protein
VRDLVGKKIPVIKFLEERNLLFFIFGGMLKNWKIPLLV